MDLFPCYVPLYKSIVLTYRGYFIEEYLNNNTIAEFIVKYKKNNNLTLKNISSMIGFSISHISNLINGKNAICDFAKKVNLLKDRR
ncbi:helix-turn-helix domain-containing protein [Paraclostridium sordellii]|uniref:helix-turn-helix domain-containing protein n=1 Tax=Paraclostridium sordellii TaxID=1505 RepID=UPI00070B5E06|nr:helix-turn-helix domain-containing protein [Paeniclostridium sordellii]